MSLQNELLKAILKAIDKSFLESNVVQKVQIVLSKFEIRVLNRLVDTKTSYCGTYSFPKSRNNNVMLFHLVLLVRKLNLKST